MSDRSDLLSALRSCPDVLLVEPSSQQFTQDELHGEAQRLLANRGLPKSHPYVGWHSQAEAFDRSGSLHRAQLIYFGGDREIVSRALSALETKRFAVLGGRSDYEAFAIRRNALPEHVDADEKDAWRIRLDVLADKLIAQLRPDEERMLHEIVAHTELRELLPLAVRALRLRSLLNAADLDQALAADALEVLGTHRVPGEAHSERSMLVVAALKAQHPLAAAAASSIAAAGQADAEIFAAWGGPDARAAAHDHALGDDRIPSAYLALVESAGDDPVRAAVELAEEKRAAFPEKGDAVAAMVGSGVVSRFGSFDRTSALLAIRDERVPNWLGVVIAETFDSKPVTPYDAASMRARSDSNAASDDVLVEWRATVDEIRRAEGLPPSPGFDVLNSYAYSAVVDNREFMVEQYGEGMRAALHRDDLPEPTIAVLLEVLYPAGLIGPEELDALTAGWRKRLFVKPGTHTPAPPALVTLALACIHAGHPEGAKIVDVVLRDKRKWVALLQIMLKGVLDRGRDADCSTEAELLPLVKVGDKEALHALSIVRSRLRGISTIAAACESMVEGPWSPGYVPRGFAAVAVAIAEGGTGFWAHYFRDRSLRAFEAALAVASDESLPLKARQMVLTVVSERSTVLSYPDSAGPVSPHPDDVVRLKARLTELESLLRADG